MKALEEEFGEKKYWIGKEPLVKQCILASSHVWVRSFLPRALPNTSHRNERRGLEYFGSGSPGSDAGVYRTGELRTR